jgi:hypothetical protein
MMTVADDARTMAWMLGESPLRLELRVARLRASHSHEVVLQ